MSPFTLGEAPSRIACYASDSSGLDVEHSLISLAFSMLERQPDGSYSVVDAYDGLQAPLNELSAQSTAIHGLRMDDVHDQSLALERIEPVLQTCDVVLSWCVFFDKRMFHHAALHGVEIRWHEFFINRERHPTPPSGPKDGLSRARLRVDHMVECLNTRYEGLPCESSGPVWLEWVLAHPSSRELPPWPEFTLTGNAKFERVFTQGMIECKAGTSIDLWTKWDAEIIVGYNRRAERGSDRCFHLLKSRNRKVAKCLANNGRVDVTVLSVDGLTGRIRFEIRD